MTTAIAAGLALTLLWMLAASCGFWIYWISHWVTAGQHPLPKWEPAEHGLPVASLLLALAYLGMSIAPGEAPIEPEQLNLNAAIVVSLMTFGVFSLAVLLEPTAKGQLRDRGFRWDDLWGQLNVGSLGMIAAVAPVAIMLLVTFPLRSEEAVHPLLQLLKQDPSLKTIGQTMLIAVVLAPLSEELIFRVILQGWLTRYVRPGAAIPLIALIFAAIHGLPDALPLIPLALILGYVYHRQRSYLAVVITHALFNGVNVVLLLGGLQMLPPESPPPNSPPEVSQPDHAMQRPAPVPLPERLPKFPHTATGGHD